MGAADFWKPGDYNIQCDRTGFKIKAAWAKKEWTGNTVRHQSWESRHPQDLIRSIPDRQDVPDPNPESPDVFLEGKGRRVTQAPESVINLRVTKTGDQRVLSDTSTYVQAGDL